MFGGGPELHWVEMGLYTYVIIDYNEKFEKSQIFKIQKSAIFAKFGIWPRNLILLLK